MRLVLSLLIEMKEVPFAYFAKPLGKSIVKKPFF